MTKSSQDWNEGLANDLKNFDFSREFILAALEDGTDLQEALGKVIRGYGVKEFSDITGIAAPNILRAVDPKHNPTKATLDALLKPFKLKLSVVPQKDVA